jgi:hypothetical protein
VHGSERAAVNAHIGEALARCAHLIASGLLLSSPPVLSRSDGDTLPMLLA